LTNAFLIFVATLALGVRFNLPRYILPYSATIASVSYFVGQWLLTRGATAPEASFVAAFMVAMISDPVVERLQCHFSHFSLSFRSRVPQ